MIRRTKDEVLTELPPKTRERITLKMSTEQRQLLEKGIAEFCAIDKDKTVDPITKKSAFMTLWRECGKIKLPSVIEYVNDVIDASDEEEKLIIFAHHKALLDALEEFIGRRKGLKYIRIDGNTLPKHRTRMVDDEFQKDPEVRVALLSITAAGVGLNMTSCCTAIFAELYFTCGSLLQAEDRIHRLGQLSPVTIKYLIAEHSAEERVWAMLMRKMDVQSQLLGDADGKMDSKRLVYDEDISQTDMELFIAAVTGRDVRQQDQQQQVQTQIPFPVEPEAKRPKRVKVATAAIVANVACPSWSPSPN